ncbi:uncharacterized protein LOC127126740 isoform X2 [Lathyrus oleraceus]|uniref:DEUBAD domain-containing protein n=1 Tax=Pisum sativum TaxID=3888 RepID=A0A9D4XVT4_PEA|nr:uncharacterized protein LOC127126740 isoform X2 [Pisum sativum]KAI5427979.1 hypothetical protein KIW84_033118 [Pisum sativum]
MLMASDQRRKRLNGASMVGYGSLEQCRTKRKNFGPPVQSDLTMKSHISVEWDSNHQRVVAKREQIGISWRQMKPFARFDHNGHEVLADVLAIPGEIFDLDSLSGVLSNEVWNTHLLDNERDFLKQFLPGDLEPHQVVQELLSGDDLHFGNPFLKWGASLCSGELHPDMIVYQEQHLKSDKRAYFSQLRNYHKDMIGFLIKLKERWESCKDPEKDILPNTLRSKNVIEKRKLSNLNEFRDDDHDGNITVTSDSYSWGAEEKAYGDSQISSKGQGDELQKRVLGKDFNKGNPRNMMASSDFMINVGGRPNKGGKLPKENIHASDGDKYMSYIKISKKQHELVKGLKLSCKSIPASTLNCVLGDLDNFNAQPYGLFIKEEQKNLHEHWLQLVKKHLPASYASWTERLIEKRAMRNSLLLEMKNKPNVLVEDEDILSTGVQAQDKEDGGFNKQSSLEDKEDSIVSIPENPSLHNSYHSGDDELHHLHIDSKNDILSKGDDALHNKTGLLSIMNSQNDPIDKVASFSSDEDSIARFQESLSLHNSYHISDKELRRLHIDLERSILSKGDDASQNKAGHSRITHFQKDPIGEEASLSYNEDSISRFPENTSVNKSYSSGDEELHSLHIDLEKNILSKVDDASQNKTEHSRIMHSQDDPMGEGAPFSYNEDYVARFPENLSVSKSYHSGDEELHRLHIDLEKNILSKVDVSQNKSEHSRIMNSRDDSIGEGSSNGHAWQAVEMPHSYYDLAATHNYSAGGLSLVNSQMNKDKQIQMIGPESNFHQDTGKELLHRQSADGSFSSYQSPDQVGLIQSLIKDKGVNSYHHEQKRAGLIFQPSNDVPMVDGQFSSHFKESLQTSLTLDQDQRQAGNFYVPENVSGNIYSDAGRYSIPRQDPLSPGNISDWAVSAPRMVAPSQPHVNTGDFIGQPWFSSDPQVQGAWNGSSIGSLSSQSLGTGGNSDQSLFSFLSQCNQLRSSSPYESIRHTDQFLSPRTYGAVDASTHRINAVVPPSSHPLDYLSGRDAPGALVPDDMTWTNLPSQNHVLNDQVAKAYLRSWNR